MKPLGFSLLSLNLAVVAGCATGQRPQPSDTAIASEPAPAPTAEPAAPPPEVIVELAGTRWIVAELNGAKVAPAVAGWSAQSLEFDADGRRATGHGGVNRFGGRYTQEGDKLSFGPLAMTRRAGPQAQMELESRYTAVLSSIVRWRQDGAQVTLTNAAGDRTILLEPAPKTP